MASNATHSYEDDSDNDGRCEPGLLLPVWKPQDNLSVGDRLTRGLVYFLASIYISIGLLMITPRLLASIKMITSKGKETTGIDSGQRLFSPTPANVLLLTLGSAGVRLFYLLFESYDRNFSPGDLGPNTVVASSAFNLLIGIGICVYAIPAGEVRIIRNVPLFGVTACFSVLGYVWLVIILKWSSPGIIDLWEAVLTFIFFPVWVILISSISCRRERGDFQEDEEPLLNITWKEQFLAAVTLNDGATESGEDVEENNPHWTNYLTHFLTMPWKIIIAILPPTWFFRGYATFLVSISVIGFLTLLLRDCTFHIHCTTGNWEPLRIAAIVGPNILASRDSALKYKFADAALGQLIGSNVIIVFLGIGGIWTVQAIYREFFKFGDNILCPYFEGNHLTCFKFYVDPGSLAYSLTIYCSVAVLVIVILVLRRHKSVGGELGGPRGAKIATTALLVSLWLVFVFATASESYGVVQGF